MTTRLFVKTPVSEPGFVSLIQILPSSKNSAKKAKGNNLRVKHCPDINFMRERTVTIASVNDLEKDEANFKFWVGNARLNAQFLFGVTALAGHIWHASRARLNRS